MIYVHGYYGYKNCGDEAFKCVFNKYLQGFDFCYTSPKEPPPAYPKDNDLIILGGGNVIDEYFLKSLSNWHGRIFAVGVGLSSSEALEVLKNLNPQVCYVRNKNELFIIKSKISFAEYIPDMVFSLSGNEIEGSNVGHDLQFKNDTINRRPQLDRTAVIVLSDRIISFLSSNQGFSGGVESLSGLVRLIEFLRYVGKYYNLHFLSFSDDFYHPDDALNILVASTLSGFHDRISFSSAGSHPSKAFAVLANADVVFSMKFHSLVFSLIANTPVVNLSDAPKCLSLVDEFKLSNLSCPMSMGATSDDLKKALKLVESGSFNVNNDVVTLNSKADEIMTEFKNKLSLHLA